MDNIIGGIVGGNGRQFEVVDCEFNRIYYDTIIGERFDVPPGYARVKVVWTPVLDWPEPV